MALTYMELQSIYRAEKKTPALTKIDEGFYDEVNKIISQVGEEHKESIRHMAENISMRRRNKVLMQVMRTFDSEPMNAILPEKKLYMELVHLLRKYQVSGFKADVEEEVKEEKDVKVKREEKKKDTVKLRIVKPIPSIVGSDTRNYGPFDALEEVEVPVKTAKILVDWKVAEEI